MYSPPGGASDRLLEANGLVNQFLAFRLVGLGLLVVPVLPLSSTPPPTLYFLRLLENRVRFLDRGALGLLLLRGCLRRVLLLTM